MRILSISLLNIHSLRGRHELDFRQAPLAETGLFLIAGETGAGKTTLLDAMTLALYGQVHRNTSQVDIMTQFEVEAEAVVLFEANGKLFESSWSVSRARKKIEGNIQQDQLLLYEILPSGEKISLATKKKEHNEWMKKVSGLDYAQFTRSVLLAQGDFAAFLKARPQERSLLLELLTDTKQYSAISIAAFQHHKNLFDQRNQLAALINNVPLLTDEELKDFERQIDATGENVKQLRVEQSAIAAQIGKYDQYKELQLKSSANNQEWQLHLNKASQLEASFLERETLLKLTPLQPVFAELQKTEAQLAEKASVISAKQNEQKKLEESIPHSSKQLNVGKETLANLEIKEKESEPIWQQVLALDAASIQLQDNLSKQAPVLQQYQKEASELEKQIKEYDDQLQAFLADAKEINDWLSAHKHIGEQKQAWLHFEAQRDNYITFYKQEESLTKNYNEQKEQLNIHAAKQKQLQEEIQILEKKLADLSTQFAQHAVSDQSNETPTEMWVFWEQQLATLKEKAEKHQASARLLLGFRQLLQQLDELKEGLHLEANEQHIVFQQLRHLELSKEDIEKDLRFQQSVLLLCDQREKLTAGEACPLCGALDHPSANQHEDVSKEAKLNLNKAQNQLQLHREQIQKATERINLLFENWQIDSIAHDDGEELSLQPHSSEIEKLNKEIEALERQIREDSYLNEVAPTTVWPESWWIAKLEEINAQIQMVQSHAVALKPLIEQYKQLENQFITQKSIRDTQAETLAQAEKAVSQTEAARVEAQKKNKELEESMNVNLRCFGLTFEISDSFKQERSKIGDIVKLYEENNAKQQAQDAAAKNVETQRNLAAQTLHTQLPILLEKQKALAELEQQLQSNSDMRKALLGDENPNTQKNELKAAIAHTRTQIEMASKQLQDTQKQVAVLDAEIKQLDSEKQKDLAQQKKLQQQLEKGAKQLQFEDATALLPWWSKLTQLPQLEALFAQHQADTIKLQSIKDSLQVEQEKLAKELTTLPEEATLRTKQNQKDQEIDSINKEYGRLQGIVAQQEALNQQLKEKRAQIEKLDKALIPAEKLKNLIGKADGSKFRSFAQGLTLERLLAFANSHLQQLSNRYELIRETSNETELELVIRDAWMADAIRPIASLSGGETFIVSLALALGLSDLASGKALIQSLFIDEGFGSLDPQTLDTAIDTLEQLHSSGKKIGIISHVRELRERIGVRVIVQKQGNSGHSQIQIQTGYR